MWYNDEGYQDVQLQDIVVNICAFMPIDCIAIVDISTTIKAQTGLGLCRFHQTSFAETFSFYEPEPRWRLSAKIFVSKFRFFCTE